MKIIGKNTIFIIISIVLIYLYFFSDVPIGIKNIFASIIGTCIILFIINSYEFISENLYFNFFHVVTIGEIRRGIKIINDKLKEISFKPDIIISLNRSGSIVANMLATQKDFNTATQNVLCISRKEKDNKDKDYDYGHLFKQLNNEILNGKKVLFTFMLINTIKTFQEGFDYLEKTMKLEIPKCEYKIATIYSTPDAIEILQNEGLADKLIKAYKPKYGARRNLNKLPWIVKNYYYTKT